MNVWFYVLKRPVSSPPAKTFLEARRTTQSNQHNSTRRNRHGAPPGCRVRVHGLCPWTVFIGILRRRSAPPRIAGPVTSFPSTVYSPYRSLRACGMAPMFAIIAVHCALVVLSSGLISLPTTLYLTPLTTSSAISHSKR